ncbi:type I phosphodiesterase/nucleotide pyrophosphatase 1 [Methanocaldococcus bathoardescens]|uniref:Type I phosphodiesterase/nucleotide pyrophosphatase 1 n=1 Tax=Methanocaldococcus bathoardescens TaxID=1301915 RepID=A0A076LDP3_9EURY|nr:alkaline phosphatase family protein [Methanocaldococcus bathoardescens]AIJ04922.1 type I phosphodiesterase/nucleotide pyrophosphatase 1 [Methanocaldococcus bathoardescens]
MQDVKKVFVIGLDSAPPELLFDKLLDKLPNIKKLLENSIYGPMRSCIPAITIPAWMVMATGKTPGELGLYGFRHRKKGTYNDIWIAHSLMVKEKAVWDYLGEVGKKSILVGVPPSYPPKPIKGHLLSCFITPDASVNYTYPKSLKNEIENLVGEYIFDVVFRKDNRDEVKELLWEMTEKRFEVIRYLIQEKEWDYFQFVEIGLDRVHHAFWKYFDENHHLHEPGNKYKDVIPDYYKLLDKEIGKTLKLLDLDETAVAIVSDHGIKAMKGAFAINQWLIDEELLKIKNPEILESGKQLRFEDLDVDWSKTIAWAWGGYYARIFLNVEGREPNGIIKPEDYNKVREEIAEMVKGIRGPNREKWDTKVFYPEDIYPETKGDKPDMMVYLDNLSWRSAGTLGYDSPYLLENDTGPDDAVHSEYGVFSLYVPGMEESREITSTIYDFAPTILKLFGIEKPLRGRSIL